MLLKLRKGMKCIMFEIIKNLLSKIHPVANRPEGITDREFVNVLFKFGYRITSYSGDTKTLEIKFQSAKSKEYGKIVTITTEDVELIRDIQEYDVQPVLPHIIVERWDGTHYFGFTDEEVEIYESAKKEKGIPTRAINHTDGCFHYEPITPKSLDIIMSEFK